ncbi:MAG: DUF2147 domain-containing protein [Bacteroidales bacterium]|nr:DUF2147 domain-containing protein [Bacteroidales bacterium]
MKNFYCKVLLMNVLVLLLIAFVPLKAQDNKADRLIGTYRVVEPETKEDSKVKIFKTADGKYKGQVIWLAVPQMKDGSPKRDILNPDPKKRNTPGDQIVLLWNFVYDAEKDMWVNGEIYDPCHGKTYKCRLNFESDTRLKVRGYIGTPALGKSMYWYKID